MKIRLFGLVLFLLALSSLGYSVTIQELIFPYKGIVFNAVGVPRSNYNKIKMSKEEMKFIQFTYKGKEYSAKLYNYGAIILSRGENQSVISVDMTKYKFPTFISPRKISTK